MLDSVAVNKQPAPTGNGDVVLDKILKRIDCSIALVPVRQRGAMMGGQTVPLLRQVASDLIARADMGQKKYGTLLRTNNGRNATVDLYQELLDALMYAEQAYEERKEGGYLVPLLLSITCQIAQAIKNENGAE